MTDEAHRRSAMRDEKGKGDRRVFVRTLDGISHFSGVCHAARESFCPASLTTLRSAATIARRFSTPPMTAGSTWIFWRDTRRTTVPEFSGIVS